MKFSTVAVSLCVLGSASAFVLPVPARSGESELHVSNVLSRARVADCSCEVVVAGLLFMQGSPCLLGIPALLSRPVGLVRCVIVSSHLVALELCAFGGSDVGDR